jgi:hypothetical protein
MRARSCTRERIILISIVSDQPFEGPGSGVRATPDGRGGPRTNIFVIATLYTPTGSAPVRIRNMSRNGALVEGGALPAAGTEVRLSRGSLAIGGRVVWCHDGKAGLRLDGWVSVTEWLPSGKRNVGQQRIDEIVYQAKRSGLAGAVCAPRASLPSRIDPAQLAGELTRLRDALDQVAHGLSNDPQVTELS